MWGGLGLEMILILRVTETVMELALQRVTGTVMELALQRIEL